MALETENTELKVRLEAQLAKQLEKFQVQLDELREENTALKNKLYALERVVHAG